MREEKRRQKDERRGDERDRQNDCVAEEHHQALSENDEAARFFGRANRPAGQQDHHRIADHELRGADRNREEQRDDDELRRPEKCELPGDVAAIHHDRSDAEKDRLNRRENHQRSGNLRRDETLAGERKTLQQFEIGEIESHVLIEHVAADEWKRRAETKRHDCADAVEKLFVRENIRHDERAEDEREHEHPQHRDAQRGDEIFPDDRQLRIRRATETERRRHAAEKDAASESLAANARQSRGLPLRSAH